MAVVALYFLAMLLAALLLEPLARRLRLPFSAALVAAGFAGSELLVGMGIDTGLRWYHFHDLVFYIFLPVLIFQSAVTLDARLLLRNLPLVLLLVMPLLVLSAGLIAVLLFYGIGQPDNFPWLAALVAGVLLSAIDPVAVNELSQRLPLPNRLLVLLEGESLFNDATTVVLFMLLMSLLVSSGGADVVSSDALLIFPRIAFGGLALGLLCGIAGRWLMRWLSRDMIISLLVGWAAYLLAEVWLGVSGIMAALASGLWIGHARRADTGVPSEELASGWEQLGWVANSALFLLAGVTVTLPMFEQRWLAMLLGIAAALVSRFLVVWLAAGLTSMLPGLPRLTPGCRWLMAAGGLRGAVTLALALTLPVSLEGWWTIQSIAYGVVGFSLFVQAPLLEPLVRLLNRRGALFDVHCR